MNELKLDILKEQIPYLTGCKVIEQINKGFSTDKKYIVNFEENKNLLLRLSDIKEFDSKSKEFKVLKELQTYNIKSSLPIDFGKIKELDACYMLLTYIEGKDALELLPQYSEGEQYNIGLEAGMELAKMHEYHAPESILPWHTRKLKKHEDYIEAYKNCGIKIKGDEKIISFIKRNVKYMNNRPNTFQHDDFHVGNIIVNNKQYAGAIDFNRYDFGDPLHDFYKVALFSREISVAFSCGQIVGYHKGKIVSEEFWRLYALYAAMSIFSSVVWSIKVTPNLVDEMIERMYMIIEDHKCFENLKPTWYI